MPTSTRYEPRHAAQLDSRQQIVVKFGQRDGEPNSRTTGEKDQPTTFDGSAQPSSLSSTGPAAEINHDIVALFAKSAAAGHRR